MELSEGCIDNENQRLVCRLKKSLYGPKQASKIWFKKIHQVLTDIEMEQCQANQCILKMDRLTGKTFLTIDIDDIVSVSKSNKNI